MDSHIAEDALARRTRRKILTRLIFQTSLLCLGLWLLFSGSPDMEVVRNGPLALKLWVGAVGLCVWGWRIFNVRRQLMRLKRPRQSSLHS